LGRPQPSPTIAQRLNSGYGWLEVGCHRCKTRASPLDAIRRPRDTSIWKLEAALKCRSCRKGRYAPSVHAIKLTETPEITPYLWVHPRRLTHSRVVRFDSHIEPRFNRADPPSPAADRQSTEECWEVYFGDIHPSTIIERVSNPAATDSWEWTCGFYPGSQPGEHRHGTAATFYQARADFEAAWRIFLSNRSEADFQAWRDADWHARKQAMWEAGESLPSQRPNSMMQCPCG
jgi:hypothetical protein